MKKELSIKQEEIIKRFQTIHNFKYDYSKVIYKGCKEKICIVCYDHGEFWQTPSNHLWNKGCPECSVNKLRDLFKDNTNNFINKAIKIHGLGTYDYSKTTYGKNCYEKVCIICTVENHNEFWQAPTAHLQGKGCPECAKVKNSLRFRHTIEQFIENASKIHGDKYDYSLVSYVNTMTKIDIICKRCDTKFSQTPNKHLQGRGCSQCKKEKVKHNCEKLCWKEQSNMSSNFDSFKVYIIECWDEKTGERFYKIGKSFTTVEKRYESKEQMPYEYKILKIISSQNNPLFISNLEIELQELHNQYNYKPKKEFAGQFECFSFLDKSIISNHYEFNL